MARGDFVGCIVVYMQVGEFKRCYEDILQDSGVNLGASHPVVYSPAYNIKLLGLEKLHPFDMGKFAKIIAQLEQTVGLQKVRLQPRKSRLAIVHAFANLLGPVLHTSFRLRLQNLQVSTHQRTLHMQAVEPMEVTTDILKDVHTESYLKALHTSSRRVASVVELWLVALLPISFLQRLLLRKMRTHVGGTMLAVGLAAVHGWAINVGGGMHHARFDDGACPVHQSPCEHAHSHCLACVPEGSQASDACAQAPAQHVYMVACSKEAYHYRRACR